MEPVKKLLNLIRSEAALIFLAFSWRKTFSKKIKLSQSFEHMKLKIRDSKCTNGQVLINFLQ